MKKLISVLLVTALLMVSVIPAFAAKETEVIVADAENLTETVDCEYPIIFVTGIGQTWTHLVNPDGTYKLDEEGNIIEYNLFYADFDGLLSSPRHLMRILKVLGELLATIVLDKNFVKSEDVGAIAAKLLRCNMIDENGKLPEDVEDTVKKYPLSEYNELNLGNFYRSIPCQDIVAKVGAENIFCYNYSAFSFIPHNADGLNEFITETVLGKYSDKDKVVLVPMSMGASVVSAYLAKYGDSNDVARVVSIVGAWDGSDVIADLIEAKYAYNSAEMFYDGTFSQLLSGLFGVEEAYTPLVSTLLDVALRLLSKQTLRDFIDAFINGIVSDFLLKTPSLLALIPSGRYEAIEENYLSTPELAYVKAQTREYYEAQTTLRDRMTRLENEYGMEFYFICGYGLEFGEGSPDYDIFKFLYSSPTTNSDEIIQISSTAPGATYTVPGEKLENVSDSKYLSPDGSVDLSTSQAPDRTWCFYKQKHELERNNTAINLAFALANGQIKSVDDCKDTYPQFNKSRNLYDLVKGDCYLYELEDFVEDNKNNPAKAEEVKLAQDALDEIAVMMDRTINDPDIDNAVIENARDTLVTLGVLEAEEVVEETWYMNIVNNVSKFIDKKLFDFFGTGGFKEGILN